MGWLERAAGPASMSNPGLESIPGCRCLLWQGLHGRIGQITPSRVWCKGPKGAVIRAQFVNAAQAWRGKRGAPACRANKMDGSGFLSAILECRVYSVMSDLSDLFLETRRAEI